jgi:hypothetical protein
MGGHVDMLVIDGPRPGSTVAPLPPRTAHFHGADELARTGEAGARTSTDALSAEAGAEAGQASDEIARSNLRCIGGFEMLVVSRLWRNRLGPDNVIGGIHITADPARDLTTAR